MTKAELQQNREAWRRRVDEFKTSGQSGAAWCAQQGIKPHLLYYWTQQFAKPDSPAETHTIPSQWQPVLVKDRRHEKASGTMTVRIGTATIEIPPNFDSKLLTNVVRVLNAVC